MCLLKQADGSTNCRHEECKSFYFNKQICMYNITQPSQQSGSQSTNINFLQPTIQLSSLMASKPSTLLPSQTSNSNKRPPVASAESIIGEQDTVFLNKKKVKSDPVVKNDENGQNNYSSDVQPILPNLSLISQQLATKPSTEAANTHASLINALGISNGQFCFTKQEVNPNFTYGNSAIYVPVVQSSQQQNLSFGNTYNNITSGHQNGLSPLNTAQLLAQNFKISTANSNNTLNTNTSSANVSPTELSDKSTNGMINMNTNNSLTGSALVSSLEGAMREFNTKMSGALVSQNKMLIDLKEKNDVIQDTLACLINEMSSLKNAIKLSNQDKSSSIPINSIVPNNSFNPNEVATTDTLISSLYGTNTDFEYQLVLKSNLQLPLYRERNFKFSLVLTNKEGNIVEHSNRIPMSIGIYSSEMSPKFIDANTAGNKILKGFIEKDLVNGTVTFEKIQIKEVTSHFRNGWIFFVVHPKGSTNTNTNVLAGGKDKIILSKKIRPFVLEKVIVKAKKTKEKNSNEENNDQNETNIFQEEVQNALEQNEENSPQD